MEQNLRKFDEDKQKELEMMLNEQKLLEKHEKIKKLNEWKVKRIFGILKKKWIKQKLLCFKLQKEIERGELIEKTKRDELKKIEKEFEKKKKQVRSLFLSRLCLIHIL